MVCGMAVDVSSHIPFGGIVVARDDFQVRRGFALFRLVQVPELVLNEPNARFRHGQNGLRLVALCLKLTQLLFEILPRDYHEASIPSSNQRPQRRGCSTSRRQC